MNRRIIAAFLAVMFAAVIVRAVTFPKRYELRDADEIGYISSSLAVVEGLAPGYQPSPAGPLVWLGWGWAELKIVRELFDPNVARLPLQLRPFFAINLALFDLYHDMSGMRYLIIGANFLLQAAAVAAGFDYGRRRGGWAGAVAVGGMVALARLMVEFTAMSRPYSMAWSFGILAVDASAALSGRRRCIASAVLCGLAIGSRIEMLCMIPWFLWEFWDRREAGALLKVWGKFVVLSLATAYFAAPWLMTGLAGNLRAIATIQLFTPLARTVTKAAILYDFIWTQGFGAAAVLLLVGIPLWVAESDRFRRGTLAAFVLLLASTVLKTTGFGLHQKGPAVLGVILASGMAMGAIHTRWPKFTPAILAMLMALPLLRTILWARNDLTPPSAPAADWIEAHVPSGSVVYDTGLIKAPLPTPEAADTIWHDVTAPDAWQRKFASGLSRFGLSSGAMPRAMSEENMIQERGNVRRWFILGSAGAPGEPRYDFRPTFSSPVFGVQNVTAEFAKTGGILLWRPWLVGPPPSKLGNPLVSLPGADGIGALVFCSSDLRPRILAVAP
jgi:hypothetical protein